MADEVDRIAKIIGENLPTPMALDMVWRPTSAGPEFDLDYAGEYAEEWRQMSRKVIAAVRAIQLLAMEPNKTFRLGWTMSTWQPIETAPKDRRILAYGKLGFEDEASVGTIMWNRVYSVWNCDPNEATEYDPEECKVTHWMPLPEPPALI